MQYTICIQHYDENGNLSQPFFPDIDATFDLPYDAKQHLLALVADELALATVTFCHWLGQDALEVFQPARKAPYQRRRYTVVPIDCDGN